MLHKELPTLLKATEQDLLEDKRWASVIWDRLRSILKTPRNAVRLLNTLKVTYPIVEETKFHKLLFSGLEEMGFGKWGFTADPYEMAQMMIAHIDKKRKALGIDKARERVLVSMDDRREMEAA